jgi:hypothetical protein
MTENFIQLSTYIERSQDEALDSISTKRMTKQEHIRRALDIYFSTPSIQRDLKAAKAGRVVPTSH